MNRIVKAKYSGKRYGFRYLLECNYCHKEFSINGADFKYGVGKFCSFSCRTAYRNSIQKGNKSNNWKGGKIKTKFGYIRSYAPSHPFNRFGYVLEHRLVMEKYLNRFLSKDEIVHHKNGDTSDNRIKNLILMKESEHSSFHHPTSVLKNVSHDLITGRFVSHK